MVQKSKSVPACNFLIGLISVAERIAKWGTDLQSRESGYWPMIGTVVEVLASSQHEPDCRFVASHDYSSFLSRLCEQHKIWMELCLVDSWRLSDIWTTDMEQWQSALASRGQQVVVLVVSSSDGKNPPATFLACQGANKRPFMSLTCM